MNTLAIYGYFIALKGSQAKANVALCVCIWERGDPFLLVESNKGKYGVIYGR